MKTTVFSLLFILSISFNSYSQSGWYWQFPSPQGNDLNTIDITSDGTLFAGGYAGTIMKSSTGADTWEVQNNVQQYNGWFHKISFVNNNTGWAVGQDWALYFTTNKGATWSMRYLNNSIILYDLFFLDENTGWASGTSSTIIKTTNNWASWITQSYSPAGAHLRSIAFSDTNTGYCVGSPNGGTYGSVMYNTTNSGVTWNQVSSPVTSSLEFIRYLTANILLIATGNGEILRSSNGGSNWSVVQLSPNNQLNEFHFINTQTGWVVGAAGKIFKTTNAGVDWFGQLSNTTKSLNSVKFTDVNTGFAVGGDGNILKTTNGGSNWNSKTDYLLSNENNNIQVIKFLNINTGFIFGYNGLIAKSTDGGVSWTGQQSNTTSNLMRSCFIDDNNIWAAGFDGTILKTSNGGITWTVVPFPVISRITGIHFVDINTGYVLTQLTQKFFKTTDGGLSWIIIPTGPQFPFGNNTYFINSATGFIVGNSGLINKTVNGGNSWTSYTHSPSRDFYDISFINNNTGWVCGDGGIILKTTNTGTSWSQQNISGQPLLKIKFIDENYGWTVGYYGYIRKTTNGGQNWDYILSGTDNWLQDIFFINQTTGWIAGFSGILKTTNGGNVINVINEESFIPLNYSLHQNYPNPFNPVTKIKFDVPANVKSQTSNVKLIIYDILGREVTTLVNEALKSGSYEAVWDGSNFASGIYFYILQTEEFTQTKKMVLMK